MNIVFFTQEDPFYVKIFFDVFFKKYRHLDNIKAVVISQPMGEKTLIGLARQMYNLYGLADFIKMGTKFSYYKMMSKRKIKLSKLSPETKTFSVKQTVDMYQIPVIQRSDINSKNFIELIKNYNADLFISIASPIIFKAQLINIPNIGSINIHNAPLPDYRGMLPNFWQLYYDEKNTGITIHKIDENIDSGDILVQKFIPIENNETLDSLIIKTKKINAYMIIEIIEAFSKGMVQYSKMEGEGSYFSFPTRDDVAKFKEKGKKIL